MELLLHQWGDWPELYRNTDKTEATEIVIIDSQMNYRGKLDTYNLLRRGCKKEGLMQYKCMEREMRTLSMEGFYFPSVMYIAIIPAGMQL